MQRIDDVVDDLAANVEELATELKQKIAYLDERHHLLKQLEELEPNSRQSIKELRERVALLQAIARYGSSFDNGSSTARLPPMQELTQLVEISVRPAYPISQPCPTGQLKTRHDFALKRSFRAGYFALKDPVRAVASPLEPTRPPS